MCIKQEQNIDGDQFIGRNGYTLEPATMRIEQEVEETNVLHLGWFTDEDMHLILQNTTDTADTPEESNQNTNSPIASNTLETNNTDQSSEGR